MDVLDLYKNILVDVPGLRKYKDWNMFYADVSDNEWSEYYFPIMLVLAYKDDLPEKLEIFKTALDPKWSEEDADVLLITGHKSKGLEYDHVEVQDDFIDLKFNPNAMQFDVKSYGDDLNLWYVAVTRAKKKLRMPSQWWSLIELLDFNNPLWSNHCRGKEICDFIRKMEADMVAVHAHTRKMWQRFEE